MANLSTSEKQILERLFQMGDGYVLNFTDQSFAEFFRDDFGMNIFDDKYCYASGSKANRLRGLWLYADDNIVGLIILKLIEYIDIQIKLGYFKKADFSEDITIIATEIGEKLFGGKLSSKHTWSQATFKDGNINIILQKDIFDHVQKLLNSGHYFTAVEEAYKVVRKKLEIITGKEKATDAFCVANYEKIFGHKPVDRTEEDFFEGVKFLHMAIQFLRNEKAHTPARDLNKNLAIHYIALASLAYDLICRKQ